MRISADREHLLAELEARQDEVLEQLDALERRLDKLLAEYNPPATAKPTPPLAEAA